MAYLDLEWRNVRLLWDVWGDRLTAIALIAFGLSVAHVMGGILVPPLEMVPIRP